MTPGRILVTGAGGFVGRHLAPALQAAFPEAALILCGPNAHSPDITDPAQVERFVAETRPDACVHLAAISSIRRAEADPDRAWRVNLHGTLHLARAILRHAPDCVLLFASSGDCYGASFSAHPKASEQTPLAPMNLYSATKSAADLALGAMAAEGLRCVRLRPFNHTGPGQSAEFAVPSFARQIACIEAGLQEPCLRIGALHPRRDFLDVRDVCAAYAACLRAAESLPRGAVLNIASGTPRRIGAVLNDLLKIFGVKADVATDPARLRGADIPLACGDASYAQTVLGWRPQIAWSQTLRDVAEDWRARIRMGLAD